MFGTRSRPAVTAVVSVALNDQQGAALFKLQTVGGGAIPAQAPLTPPLSQRNGPPLARPTWAPPTTTSTASSGRPTLTACRPEATPLPHDPAPSPHPQLPVHVMVTSCAPLISVSVLPQIIWLSGFICESWGGGSKFVAR
ncbi:hypothetical protein SKAU_G00113820 [Synaphobranchus kaupii]|uniref:Uncharacterized protein n=1 Tax=Synaphobranchus kaupii TaxID=118154 RepID=A0A9Q1G1P4_SYNKA|nr:hypothetical protein SKAU_G00113820 [Synaphobranchus kaupii]